MTKKKARPTEVAEFVVQECPILGKKIVKHYITNKTKNNGNI